MANEHSTHSTHGANPSGFAARATDPQLLGAARLARTCAIVDACIEYAGACTSVDHQVYRSGGELVPEDTDWFEDVILRATAVLAAAGVIGEDELLYAASDVCRAYGVEVHSDWAVSP